MLFFLGKSMTIKFGNFAIFIVRNFVVIWEAPIFTKRPRKRRTGRWRAPQKRGLLLRRMGRLASSSFSPLLRHRVCNPACLLAREGFSGLQREIGQNFRGRHGGVEKRSGKFGWHLAGVWIQSPKNIFQRPKFPGKSLKFRRKSDFRQISGSEI